ncbi:MAG: hypothetical protein QM820_40470 [Minicystis sp.]
MKISGRITLTPTFSFSASISEIVHQLGVLAEELGHGAEVHLRGPGAHARDVVAERHRHEVRCVVVGLRADALARRVAHLHPRAAVTLGEEVGAPGARRLGGLAEPADDHGRLVLVESIERLDAEVLGPDAGDRLAIVALPVLRDALELLEHRLLEPHLGVEEEIVSPRQHAAEPEQLVTKPLGDGDRRHGNLLCAALRGAHDMGMTRGSGSRVSARRAG